ncbi:MAG TPA: hypothetical protein VMR45_05690 [Patescibacteria group bacterium]|nr:hypothetical protein [Patescibacteria group bacterium]
MSVETVTLPISPDQIWGPDNPPLDGSQLYTYDDLINAPVGFMATDTRKLRYPGLEPGIDAYNPSGKADVRVWEHSVKPTPVVTARTEESRGAYNAVSRFCEYDARSGNLREIRGLRRLPWEDPTLQVTPDGLIIATGIHVVWNSRDTSRVDRLFNEVYVGDSLENLQYAGQFADGFKDDRVDPGVVYLRPQGGEYDEGKITYTVLEDDSTAALEDALRSGTPTRRDRVTGPGKEIVLDELCRMARFVGAAGIFAAGTWGGPNSILSLGQWNLVESHAATREPGSPPDYRIYEGFNMLHQPQTNEVRIFRPHLTVNDFPPAGAKTKALRRVFFTGGMYDVEVGPDYEIAGKTTGGLGDKEMCDSGFRTVRPLGELMASNA